MLYIYKHGSCTYEFDATSRADELAKARTWAKEHGWKFIDIIKET